MSFFADAIQRGTRASQPLASAVVVGALYYVTDEKVTEQSNGSTWETYTDAGGDLLDITTSLTDTTLVLSPDGFGGVEFRPETISTPVGPDGLLSGGQVVWVGNLDFIVSAATYRLAGVDYSSAQTSISLDTADASDDRIDIIALDNSGVIKITGTAAPTPAAPDVDPETQLALTFVYVPATSSTPADITNTDLYLENTEWTSGQTGGHVTLASTNNPFAGTKDIEATSAVATDTITLTKPAAGTEDLTQYNNLVLNIRLKASWPNAKSLVLQWLNGASATGSAVTLKGGVFNLDNANTTTYQQIAIPISTFNVPGVVTALRFTVTGGGAAIGFYLDNIFLQAGVTSITLPSHIMIFRGNWSSAVSYKQDDVVINSSIAYVALAPNVNSTPPSANWQALGSGSSGLGDPGSNGVVVRTALNTTTNRTITGTSNKISVTNGDGVSGNPTLTVPSSAQLDIAKITNLTSNGFVKTGSGDGTLSVDTSTYLTSSTGVTSIAKNGSTALVGNVTLTGGTNVTLTQAGQDISIAASGGGGLTIGDPVSGGTAQAILFVDGSGNLADSSTFTFTPAVHGHFEITDSTPNYVKLWANDSSAGSPMIQLSQGGGSRLLTIYCDASGGSRALITTSGANELRLTATGNIRGMFIPTGVEGCLGLDDNSGNALYIRESSSDLIASNNAGTTPNANYSAKRLKYNEALFSNNSFSAPGSPTDGDFWIEASGTSPARTINLQVRDGGGTRTLATLTY